MRDRDDVVALHRAGRDEAHPMTDSAHRPYLLDASHRATMRSVYTRAAESDPDPDYRRLAQQFIAALDALDALAREPMVPAGTHASSDERSSRSDANEKASR